MKIKLFLLFNLVSFTTFPIDDCPRENRSVYGFEVLKAVKDYLIKNSKKNYNLFLDWVWGVKDDIFSDIHTKEDFLKIFQVENMTQAEIEEKSLVELKMLPILPPEGESIIMAARFMLMPRILGEPHLVIKEPYY